MATVRGIMPCGTWPVTPGNWGGGSGSAATGVDTSSGGGAVACRDEGDARCGLAAVGVDCGLCLAALLGRDDELPSLQTFETNSSLIALGRTPSLPISQRTCCADIMKCACSQRRSEG